MMDPTQAAGAMPAPAPGADPAASQQGATVCIASQPDGTFLVYPEGQDDQGQPAQDVDSACDMAKQMLGGAQDPKAADAQADDLFQTSFNNANPRAPK